MQLRTFGAISATVLSIGAGAATQVPEWAFLARPLAITAGVVWLFVAAVFIYRNRRHPFWKTIKDGGAKMEPHLIGAAVVGIGAWRQSKLTWQSPALGPHSAPATLTDDERRFREKLRTFVVSDVLNMVRSFQGFSNRVANDYSNPSSNRQLSELERKRVEDIYWLYASNHELETQLGSALNSFSKPDEQVDIKQVQQTLPQLLRAYDESVVAFLRFLRLSGFDIEKERQPLEDWLKADERAWQASRELRSTWLKSDLVDSMINEGLFETKSHRFRQNVSVNDHATPHEAIVGWAERSEAHAIS